MTPLTIHTVSVTVAASHGSGHGGAFVTVVLLAAVVYGIAYRASLHRYPYKNCSSCRGSGRRRAPFFRAHRACPRCAGSGEQLRRYARKPQ